MKKPTTPMEPCDDNDDLTGFDQYWRNVCWHTTLWRDEHVADHQCVACPPGTERAGDLVAGSDTSCSAVLCAKTPVANHECIPCDTGWTNAPGDDASGVTLCGRQELRPPPAPTPSPCLGSWSVCDQSCSDRTYSISRYEVGTGVACAAADGRHLANLAWVVAPERRLRRKLVFITASCAQVFSVFVVPSGNGDECEAADGTSRMCQLMPPVMMATQRRMRTRVETAPRQMACYLRR